MTTRRDRLDQAHRDLEALTKKIVTGTADRPRHTRIIDIALQHMDEWAATRPVRLDHEGPHRGGTTSSTTLAERAEDHIVGRAAAYDHAQAVALMRTISVATEQLYLLARRYTTPIDTAKLPKVVDTIPGCVSCARTKKKGPLTVGGHFAPIYDARPHHKTEGLCRWCGDHHLVNGQLPSIEAIDIYHREGPQAAGRYLARQQRRPARKETSR